MNRAQRRAQEKAQQKQQQDLLNSAVGCNRLAMSVLAQDPDKAHDLMVRALTLDPLLDGSWLNYQKVLKHVSLKAPPKEVVKILLKRLIEPSYINGILMNIATYFVTISKNIIAVSALADDEKPNHPFEDDLLFTLMKHHVLISVPLEIWLTQLRKMLLLSEDLSDEKKCQWYPFLDALAAQCFHNEYVFWQGEDEEARLQALNLQDEWDYKIAACYSPLNQKEQLQKERELAATIPALEEVTDEVSKIVKAQYEQNPYPRWEKMQLPPPRPVREEINRVLPHQTPSAFAGLPDAPEVLVAGCGTGRHALQVAARYKDAEVLGIDLSSASLGYAKGKIEELGFSERIELMQADILSLGKLNRKFDIIESAGVLHHMHDPIAGWKVLTGLLKPTGLMKIALYSEAARKEIVMARELIARRNYESTPKGIRQCRRDIMFAMPQLEHLKRVPDFYAMSECRDLIFHVQEHRYTLPQLEKILEELQLEFLGFEHPDDMMEKQYALHFPYDDKQVLLTNWERLEKQDPKLFFGMYQMWLRPKA